MSEDIHVVAIVKGEERYVFLFDDKTRAETLRTLGRYASSSELSFSWYDAAVLSQKIRKTKPTTPHSHSSDIRRVDTTVYLDDETESFQGFVPFDDTPPLDDF